MLKKMPETRLTIDVASLILEKIEEEKWEKFKEKKVGKSKKKSRVSLACHCHH